MDSQKELRRHVVALLKGGQAHITFEDALRDFPAAMRGAKPAGAPHTAWQLLEHLRLAQRDILDFSRNEDGKYQQPQWPDDYWPKEAAPPNVRAWDRSVGEVCKDAHAMEKLVADPKRDLFAAFAWGEGQTLLREA